MSLLFYVEIVFFMIHILSSHSLFYARRKIIFNLKGRFVLITEMNARKTSYVAEAIENFR